MEKILFSVELRPERSVIIEERGAVMDGILFLAFWIGGAALHTLYDLKVKPRLKNREERVNTRTF